MKFDWFRRREYNTQAEAADESGLNERRPGSINLGDRGELESFDGKRLSRNQNVEGGSPQQASIREARRLWDILEEGDRAAGINSTDYETTWEVDDEEVDPRLLARQLFPERFKD